MGGGMVYTIYFFYTFGPLCYIFARLPHTSTWSYSGKIIVSGLSAARRTTSPLRFWMGASTVIASRSTFGAWESSCTRSWLGNLRLKPQTSKFPVHIKKVSGLWFYVAWHWHTTRFATVAILFLMMLGCLTMPSVWSSASFNPTQVMYPLQCHKHIAFHFFILLSFSLFLGSGSRLCYSPHESAVFTT